MDFEIIEEQINFELLTEIISFQVDTSGVTSFIELIDTPNNYGNGSFLISTASGFVYTKIIDGGNF